MSLPVSRRAAFTSLALAIAAPAALADNLVAATLSPVIVTATRTPQAAADVLSDNVYIGPEEIARAGVDSVIDLLQKQRGIEVTRNGGPGTSASVFIRGANSKQNIVLIDGVRIGSSTTGEANWSAIPLSAVDHIEIVYGPLSTLYGADALGGVIQIFTKKGSGAPRLSALVGAGSDGTGTLDAAISGSTGGEHDFNYALGVGKEKANGFSAIKPGVSKYNADADGYDKENVSGRFGLQLAKGQEVGLLVLHSRLDSQYDNGPLPYDARNVRLLENVAAFSKNEIAPNWASQFQVAQARDKLETFASATDYSLIRTLQTDVSWQNDIRLGADMLQLLFDHRKEEVLSSSSSALTRERTTKSVAASYSVKHERHLLSIGARRRQQPVRFARDRQRRLRLPPEQRAARQRQLRHQLPRADLQRAVRPELRRRQQPAGKGPQRGNRPVLRRWRRAMERGLLPQPRDRPAGDDEAMPGRSGAPCGAGLRLQRRPGAA
jgi:vitamin B12 transporter